MPVKDCVQLGFCVWFAVKLKWAKSEMLRFFFVFIFIFRIFFFSFNCSLYYFLLFRSSFFPVRFFLCGQRCARPATVYDNIGSTNKRIFGSNFIRISSLSNAYIESTKWAKWAHTNTTQHNAPLPFHFHIRWCVCVCYLHKANGPHKRRFCMFSNYSSSYKLSDDADEITL